ncbi:MAG TPA: hypothetical protein VFN26_06110 [Candidatus Acidoferrum sp.]|nr:hypothetical protein [Candidatus Acidoferrum sp.]
MATVAAAFPFIEVRIDTSALVPVAQRLPGVIAIVGKTAAGVAGGTAATNKPFVVDTLDQAADLFAKKNGVVAETDLYRSIKLAMLQDPVPSKIYGVRTDGDKYAAALAALEAVDDVTFVSLANESNVGNAAAGGNPSTGLTALKDHVENMSAQGQKRIGVSMLDPTKGKTNTYVADMSAAVATLKSDTGRMVLIAARGATGDAASAAMAAMAGYKPHISMVLKQVRGIQMPKESQYGPSEIKGLSEANIDPIIQSSLIVGDSLRFGEARIFGTDPGLLYIDIVRTLDDIDFRLKAGLIGQVGDARITKPGMTKLKVRTDEILDPLRVNSVIADYSIDIPVLNVLSVPDSTWSAADRTLVTDSRANRTVDMFVSVTYGPAVHRLKVTLAPKF